MKFPLLFHVTDGDVKKDPATLYGKSPGGVNFEENSSLAAKIVIRGINQISGLCTSLA